ncbi:MULTISPECIES: cysteine desulfurase family protein [unclassified Pseudofrankia]|uniref:cysteine desulfurase family protein n=1 Tax=unclassified Pseudofrankia TaxID=2994372 RepID=UPI0008DA3DCC|nr:MULTISPECIES: cysteine desulfurase family protein [unclassified Pseudofrankia]MDT3446258.1 cysteine desulfurase family protein [Pseudofrankia sp. BMG5.37]OHV49861.1 cysteine desulfurase [Pseudofrankia sp. BMG5.36]
MNYLDHAATTPMRPEALAAWTAAHALAGNPSSLHAGGRRARRVVEESRESLATQLGCRPSELIFTGGGTESDNLALKGLYWARRAADPRRCRVLVSAVEHHAVLDPAHWLEQTQGATVELLPVDETGLVRPETLAAALADGPDGPDDVALVSVMWANNEVGTVQPVAELAAACHAHGIPFHTDAVQAFGQVPISFAESGVDAMTVTAHKIGGPVGIGALVLRRGLTVTALTHGGGQERDVRSGTLDTAGAAAFAAAAAAAVHDLPAEARRLAGLRDGLIRQVLAKVPTAVLNGAPAGPGRLPGNAHLSFPGCEGDSLLMLLDARGIECSTGSACTSGVARPSHVLLAMGAGEETARGSLRFSFGHTSTEADVAAVAGAIAPVYERASRAGELAGLGGS